MATSLWRRIWTAAMLVLAAVAAAAEQVEVRVRQTPGGPQIFVDGKPVPPHMFWGREIIANQPVSGEWRPFKIAHTPAVTVEKSEVRFAYQPVTGSVEVRNFTFGSASNLAWRIDRKATDKTMWKSVPAGRLERGVRYDMSFEARADGIAWIRPGVEQLEDGPYHYQFVQVPPDDPELDTLVRQARLAIAAGVRMVTFYAPNCWQPEGEEDWELLDRIFRKLIALDPDVLIIPRVTLNAPEWWQKAHPDDCMVMEDGSSCGYACISSRAYRRDACAYVEKVCRHMMEKYPHNFAGIHPSGQNSNEWFYKFAWKLFSGYDPATRDAFRAWLAAKGEPDAATATVPTPQERLQEAPDTLFWDPVKNRRMVDFNTFLQEEMGDFVSDVLKACRRATDGKKLVMTFYGYAWSFASYFERAPAASGHFALARLLERAGDSVDILSAPISYNAERGWLGSTPHVSVIETLARHGILWVTEDDTVTHRNLDSWYEGYAHRKSSAFTPGQTYDVLTRNLAAQAVRNTGSWWMDLYGWNWYYDPLMWRIVADFKGLDERMCRRTTPYAPDVAIFADEVSMMYLRTRKYVGAEAKERWRGAVWAGLFAQMFQPLARLGTSYGQYLLSDALKHPVNARLQILPVFYADDATASALAKMREDAPDVTRVWCWAPAALSPRGGSDLAQMKRVTGFTFRRVEGFGRAVRSTPAGLAAGLPEQWVNKSKRQIAPRFAVEPEPGDEVWATWEDGSAAVVVRPHGKGNEVFFGSIEPPREFLAALVKRAGIFVSLEYPERATLWRTDGVLAIQAVEDGEQALLFPAPSTVRDGLTGEILGTGVVRLPVTLRKGEVRVFTTE